MIDWNFQESTTDALVRRGCDCTHPFWKTLGAEPGHDSSGQRAVQIRKQCTSCGKVVKTVQPEVTL